MGYVRVIILESFKWTLVFVFLYSLMGCTVTTVIESVNTKIEPSILSKFPIPVYAQFEWCF